MPSRPKPPPKKILYVNADPVQRVSALLHFNRNEVLRHLPPQEIVEVEKATGTTLGTKYSVEVVDNYDRALQVLFLANTPNRLIEIAPVAPFETVILEIDDRIDARDPDAKDWSDFLEIVHNLGTRTCKLEAGFIGYGTAAMKKKYGEILARFNVRAFLELHKKDAGTVPLEGLERLLDDHFQSIYGRYNHYYEYRKAEIKRDGDGNFVITHRGLVRFRDPDKKLTGVHTSYIEAIVRASGEQEVWLVPGVAQTHFERIWLGSDYLRIAERLRLKTPDPNADPVLGRLLGSDSVVALPPSPDAGDRLPGRPEELSPTDS